MCVNALISRPDTTVVSATFQLEKRVCPNLTNSGKNHMKTSEPITLESVCESAVRHESAVPPIAAIQPVAVVPMLAPNRTAIATSYDMSPCAARAMPIAIVAAEDCTTAVKSVATPAMANTPGMESAERRVKTAANSGMPRIGETPLDMM